MSIRTIGAFITLAWVFSTTACNMSGGSSAEKLVLGYYSASLPCSDCKKVEFRLVLKKNKTYQSSTIKVGGSLVPDLDEGTWEINDDRVVLSSSVYNSVFFYDMGKDRLFAATVNGDARMGVDKEEFTLAKINSITAGLDETLLKAFVSQADVLAHGKTWTASISKEQVLTFKIEGQEELIMRVEKHIADFENWSKIWKSKDENNDITITMSNVACKGNNFEGFEVVVELNGKPYNGCGVNANALYNINKIWNLMEVNGETLPDVHFPKGRPMIDIDIADKRFVGHTGCNFWKGGVKLDLYKIQFRPGAMTRMACPNDQNFENLIVQSLGRSWSYEIIDNHLLLKDGDDSMLFIQE